MKERKSFDPRSAQKLPKTAIFRLKRLKLKTLFQVSNQVMRVLKLKFTGDIVFEVKVVLLTTENYLKITI